MALESDDGVAGRVPAGERLLTTAEVARMLGVSRSTVYVLRNAGELKACQLRPKLTRFRSSDVDAYLKNHETAARPSPPPAA